MTPVMSIVIFLVISFIPSIVAYFRVANRRVAILVFNILFAWTVIGWVILLIYAVLAKTEALAKEESAVRKAILNQNTPLQ